jgi:uncharacterized coiled-coil DUF342 family protein
MQESVQGKDKLIKTMDSAHSEMNLQLTNLTKQYQTLQEENKSLRERYTSSEVDVDEGKDKMEKVQRSLDRSNKKIVGLSNELIDEKSKSKKKLSRYSSLELLTELVMRLIRRR